MASTHNGLTHCFNLRLNGDFRRISRPNGSVARSLESNISVLCTYKYRKVFVRNRRSNFQELRKYLMTLCACKKNIIQFSLILERLYSKRLDLDVLFQSSTDGLNAVFYHAFFSLHSVSDRFGRN